MPPKYGLYLYTFQFRVNFRKKYLPKTTICARINIVVSRRVGMADDADSKSVAGNRVRVQVPLPASNSDNPNLIPIGTASDFYYISSMKNEGDGITNDTAPFVISFFSVSLALRLNNVEILLNLASVNVGIAGVLLLLLFPKHRALLDLQLPAPLFQSILFIMGNGKILKAVLQRNICFDRGQLLG